MSKHLCDIIKVAYFAASAVLLLVESETGRSWATNAAHQTKRTNRNTLANRFSGVLLELACLATLATVSGNQKNALEDT